MKEEFKYVDTLRYCAFKVLPTVYDDTLSYTEQLGKFTNALNGVIENNNKIPDFIIEMIQNFISSGTLGEVLRTIISEYMLNVKNPPNGLKPAIGDGTADDTQAIQGCIDYANNLGGKAVYFPSGVYLTSSLTLKTKVGLVGFDRNNTKLVLRGGSTKPLISGECNDATISNLALDGNMDIQVNNLDLIDIKGSNLFLTNLYCFDGYDVVKVNVTGGVLQGDNIIVANGVVNGFVIYGTGTVNLNNLDVWALSILNGRYALDLSVPNSTVSDFTSTARTDIGMKIRSNGNVITANITNANFSYDVTGTTGNSIAVAGKEKVSENTEVYEGFNNKTLTGKTLKINTENPVEYKTPSALNDYFKTIPLKDGAGNAYDVLVKGTKDISEVTKNVSDNLAQEILNRQEAINTVNQNVSGVAQSVTDEANTRGQAVNELYGNITGHKGDNTIHGKLVDGIEYMWFFQEMLRNNQAVNAVFSGDSTTRGFAVTDPNYTVDKLFQETIIKCNISSVTTYNQGHDSMSSDDWLATYLDQDLALNPALYVLRWGFNKDITDNAQALQMYEANMRAGLTRIRATKSVNAMSIILMTPNSGSDDSTGRNELYYNQLQPIVKSLAKEFQCAFIDVFNYMRDSKNVNWLDSMDVHPLEWANMMINQLTCDVAIPKSLIKNTVLNPNSTYKSRVASDKPSAYPMGISIYRTATGGFPINGIVETTRSTDGICVQKNSGFYLDDAGKYMIRVGVDKAGIPNTVGDDTWGEWISIEKLIGTTVYVPMSTTKSALASDKPSTYQVGVSVMRTATGGGFPIDGIVETTRSADGICYQRNTGFYLADAGKCKFRVGIDKTGISGAVGDDVWGAWQTVTVTTA